MAYTEQLKDALVTDLESIDGTGGYTTAIAEVGTEPKRFDEVASPGAYIVSGDYDSETSENSTLSKLALQSFGVQLIVKSATPNSDLNTFFDDVRNAVETDSSALSAVPKVHSIDVTEATGSMTDSQIAEGVYIKELEVSILYTYVRGSA